MKNTERKWTEVFRHVPADSLGRPSFYVKGSRFWLTSGGYSASRDVVELVSKLESICEDRNFIKRRTGSDSPMNIYSSETFYSFLDGGLEIFSGNYFFGTPKQGAYIRGFHAFRWILCDLDIVQPRRFKGEEHKNDCSELYQELSNNS